MKVNPNQTALDVVFDFSGSLAGYTSFLNQLPKGERVGFDTYPTLLDVTDIGQTWTPDVENSTLDVILKQYNDSAVKKAHFSTDITGLKGVISWGEAIIESMFNRDLWQVFTIDTPVSDELKHSIKPNQTIIDAAFDLSGSLTGVQTLLEQLTSYDRIGFNNMPALWEDTERLNQTWTPDVANKKFVLDTKVYSLASIKKQPYSTDLLWIASAITWGNDFLQTDVITGDYAVDETFNFGTDENNNYITT